MANTKHLKILKKGVKAWNLWRENHPNINPDLREADLSWADLSNADLRGADIMGANLRSANLRSANLSMANLSGAGLSWANLSGAYLSGVNFNWANLQNAKLDGSQLGETVFENTDLTHAKGLDSCMHIGPSIIDIRTLERSGPLPEIFLRGCGWSDIVIQSVLAAINKNPIQFYSCFISYSSKDEEFALRLFNDLQGKGVRCWYAPEQRMWHGLLKSKILAISETFETGKTTIPTKPDLNDWCGI